MRRLGLPFALVVALGTAAAAQAVPTPCARPESQAAATSRIAKDWNINELAAVPATKAPVPQGNDLEIAPTGMPLERMLLLLES